ncbi:MAG TPA: hypothetical protein VFG55_04075 [Rhodanobacteraceae bacterium]|nr:hypothetical protein [Rhodanobacteraceae bacterium]
MQRPLTTDEAISLIRSHGIVLASARGPVPRLTEAIVGEPIRGSWWAHAESHRIFAVFQEVARSPDILVCRLVNGKVTFVHRRLWAALVRIADRFPANRLAWVRQEHTAQGHHLNRELPFPAWVPPDVAEQARRLDEKAACHALGSWVALSGKTRGPTGGERSRPVA